MEEYMRKYYDVFFYQDQINDETQAKILVYKKYLNETDYVVIKMMELLINGSDISELKTLYKDVLENREIARIKINELESEV